MQKAKNEARARASFQLDALRQAVAQVYGMQVPSNQKASYATSALRLHHAELCHARKWKQAVWVKMLIIDITYDGSFRKARGRLMRELGCLASTPDGNTGVNSRGYAVTDRAGG